MPGTDKTKIIKNREGKLVLVNIGERVPLEDLLKMKKAMDALDKKFQIMHNYDKQGKPISTFQWTLLFGDDKYKIINKTRINKRIIISTIWLGLDHGFSSIFGKGRPIIFETMIFKNGKAGDYERYSTLEEAQKGHKRWVRKYETK